jgi:pseudaminic acid synthase
MTIDDFIIDSDSKTFIVAELSANHNQKYDLAVETIRAAKEAGADAVKLQTYTPDTITLNCDNDYFRIKGDTLWGGKTLYELYQGAYTPWEWQPKLKEYAESIGLICFSSPFDKTAVDFLEQMNVPYYKIASFEITDTSLIQYAASKGKPMIISTGIATTEEIEDALESCRKVGNNKITLLKCTSQYPSLLEDANLLTIPDMKHRFGVQVGLSDHTVGNIAVVTAVALGAKLIEKHFILDRNLGGPDAEFSTEPEEFKEMVMSIRNVEKALGKVNYALSEKDLQSRKYCRSLFIVKDIKAGEIITEDNVRSIRPGYGMSPKFLKEIIGKKVSIDLQRGCPIKSEYIS